MIDCGSSRICEWGRRWGNEVEEVEDTFGIEEVIRFDPWEIRGGEEGGKWEEDLTTLNM